MGNFLKNSLLTINRQFISGVLFFLSSVIIARGLGAEGQGIYSLVILLPMMLFQFFNLGIHVSTVYYTNKMDLALSAVFRSNLVWSLILTLVSAALGIGSILFFKEYFFKDVPNSLLYFSLLIVPFMFFTKFFQAIFQAHEDFKEYNWISLIQQIFAFVLFCFAVVVFKLGVLGSLTAFGLSYFLSSALTIKMLKNKYQLSIFQGKTNFTYLKNTLTFGFKSHLCNLLSFLNHRLDILIISHFINAKAVGIYFVAVTLIEGLQLVSSSVSFVLYARICSLDSEEARNNITSLACRNIFLVSVILGLLLFFLSDIVIMLFYGKEYVESIKAFKILLPSGVVSSVAAVMSNDIAGRGKPEYNLYVSLFIVVINVFLNLIFIPKWGISGAAFATSLSFIVNFFIKVWIFKSMTNLKVTDLLLFNRNDFERYQKLYLALKEKFLKSQD